MNKENKKREVERASYQMPQVEVVQMNIESAILEYSGAGGNGNVLDPVEL